MSIGKIFTVAETKNVSSVRLGIFALFVGLFKERLMKHFIEKSLLMLLVLFAFQFAPAQEKPKPLLIDSFAYSNSEDASARIDNWRVELNKLPQNAGYILIYGGQIGKRGEIEAHMRGIKQAFALKKIDKKRVTIAKGGFREKLTVEFWIVPENASLPLPSPTVDLKKVRFRGVSRKTIPYECCF